MADIINLNKARKRLKKDEKNKNAAENRVKFGRSKSQKRRDNDPSERVGQNLDRSN